METDIALVITAVVATFVQIIKAAGGSGKWGMAWAALASFLGVVLYGVSHETEFQRSMIWTYFAAFGMVTLSAIGVFSAIKNAPEQVTNLKGVGHDLKHSLTRGTGAGAEKD